MTPTRRSFLKGLGVLALAAILPGCKHLFEDEVYVPEQPWPIYNIDEVLPTLENIYGGRTYRVIVSTDFLEYFRGSLTTHETRLFQVGKFVQEQCPWRYTADFQVARMYHRETRPNGTYTYIHPEWTNAPIEAVIAYDGQTVTLLHVRRLAFSQP